MAYIHHSHPVCSDCGEKHTPRDREECIECLKEQLEELKAIILDHEKWNSHEVTKDEE